MWPHQTQIMIMWPISWSHDLIGPKTSEHLQIPLLQLNTHIVATNQPFDQPSVCKLSSALEVQVLQGTGASKTELVPPECLQTPPDVYNTFSKWWNMAVNMERWICLEIVFLARIKLSCTKIYLWIARVSAICSNFCCILSSFTLLVLFLTLTYGLTLGKAPPFLFTLNLESFVSLNWSLCSLW